jgi:signal transduction histidine kinase/MFS family permease
MMKHMQKKTSESNRRIVVFIAFVFYLLLVAIKICYSLALNDSSIWVYSIFYNFISLLFFASGSFIWMYNRNRGMAIYLFCFSLAMMVVYTWAIGRIEVEDKVLTFSGIASGPVATFLLTILFPRDRIAANRVSEREDDRDSARKRKHALVLVRRGYLAFLTLGSIALVLTIGGVIFSPSTFFINRNQLDIGINLYYLLAFAGVYTLTVLTYRRCIKVRERQQIRLFIVGVILSIGPFLFLTLVPALFGITLVPALVSLVSSVFFPLFLVYSTLRYQILVLDSYIRRTISYITAGIFIAIFVSMIVIASNIFLQGKNTLYVLSGAVTLTAAASPFIWRMAQLITEHLFFKDTQHYRHLIEELALRTEEAIDVEAVAKLLTSVALHTFELKQACLFVLEEQCGYYRVLPASLDAPAAAPCKGLMESVLRVLKPGVDGPQADWLEVEHPALQRLATTRRPMLLSEVSRPESEQPGGLGRFLTTESPLVQYPQTDRVPFGTQAKRQNVTASRPALPLDRVGEGKPEPSSDFTPGSQDWLLVPVRAQGCMIGVLVLGEREDQQPYAGPDFEPAQLLVARFSSMLEMARLYEHHSQYAVLLNSLYTVSTMPGYTFKTINDAAKAYAIVVANATSAQAEIWYHDQQQATMRYGIAAGHYPDLFLTTEKDLCPVREEDWEAWFFDGGTGGDWSQTSVPPCLLSLSRRPEYSLAWLPLQKNGRRLGVLLLLYPRPHHFVRVEMRTLEMFADQCSATFENVRMTSDLREAYERQKELDELKDQFITTASHELRTPLTTVQGYIELLCEHKTTLPHEMLIDFVEKARLGCDELALLVSNIVDASTLNTDIKSIQVRSLSIHRAVVRVLEILGAVMERERRQVIVQVDPEWCVFADKVRMRQVLMNLLTNALHYSPEGSPIEIEAGLADNHVRIAIRDRGAGIPPEQQLHLFERFTRLERDMNSTVRGAGLGLYLSKQLVEAMGGRIWVESSGQPGEGSTFIVELQLASHDQQAASFPQTLSV